MLKAQNIIIALLLVAVAGLVAIDYFDRQAYYDMYDDLNETKDRLAETRAKLDLLTHDSEAE